MCCVCVRTVHTISLILALIQQLEKVNLFYLTILNDIRKKCSSIVKVNFPSSKGYSLKLIKINCSRKTKQCNI